MVMVVNAKYNHARLHAQWRWEQEPDLQLLFLPPYKPDLNPIDCVWKLVR